MFEAHSLLPKTVLFEADKAKYNYKFNPQIIQPDTRVY